MKRFKINWAGTVFGESFTEAETEQEARKKAEMGHTDEDFEEVDNDTSWEIDDVVEVDDNDNEI